MSKIEQVKLAAKELETEKFVEAVSTPVAPATPTTLPLHIQIEKDGVALVKLLKKAGIDFEVFLRGLHQRVENGLV